jgi:hypothetical protein
VAGAGEAGECGVDLDVQRPQSRGFGLHPLDRMICRCDPSRCVGQRDRKNNRNTVNKKEKKSQQGATTESTRRKETQGGAPASYEKVSAPDTTRLSVGLCLSAGRSALRKKPDQTTSRIHKMMQCQFIPLAETHLSSLELGKRSPIWPAKEAYVVQVCLGCSGQSLCAAIVWSDKASEGATADYNPDQCGFFRAPTYYSGSPEDFQLG